ncbi:unnamed protein product, partial [Laminaria digitata]
MKEVYDEVTEEEYQELVRKRQQADDFVVDDDGLGYADDGEEFIERVDAADGEGEGGVKGGKGRKGMNGKMNSETLRRKARKLNQLGEEAAQSGGGIKKFLRTGGGGTVGPSSLSRNSSSTGTRGGGGLNLDDMLSDLTSNPIAELAPGTGLGSSSSSSASAMISKRKRGLVTPQSARSRRSSAASSSSNSSSSMASNRGSTPRGRASLGGGGGGGGGGARRPPVPSSWTVRDYEDTEAGAGGEAGDEGGDDFDGAMNDSSINASVFFDGEEEGGGGRGGQCEGATAAATVGGEVETGVSGDDEGDSKRAAVVSPEAPGGVAGETAGEGDGGETGAAKPRSRFARMKEANDIAVTAAAEAALRPKPVPVVEKEKTGEEGAGGKGGEEAAGKAGSNYMPSLDFQGPQYELSEAPSTSAGSVPSASAWLQKDETGEFMRMFWLDATEQNGTVYLIGKVAVTSPAGGGEAEGQGTTTSYLSACVAIHGIEREVLVLPRLVSEQQGEGDDENDAMDDGTKRAEIGGVYGEMASVLVPRVIPKNSKGEQFRCKPVMRKYAFGDLSVPRDDTQYLKIKYPARYPALPEDVCEAGGKNFQAIFGARTPLIESFLIKRKLMGPCWVTVRNPKINESPVSWCKVEVAAQSPKSITRLLAEEVSTPSTDSSTACASSPPTPSPEAAAAGAAVEGSTPSKASPAKAVKTGKLPPPPPVVTMSLSMKTVVSPRTHTHEVVALSALIHREVRLDGASEDDGQKVGGWV